MIVALACGCGSDRADSNNDNPDGGPIDVSGLSYAECEATERVGGFSVNLEPKFTAAGGRVSNGVSPLGALETITAIGQCQHARALVPFCDPGCVGLEVCGIDSVCRPAPSNQTVGNVTIRGLKAAVEMEPRPPAFNYSQLGTLPHPAFDLAAPIELTSDGGSYAPLSLLGWGVVPIELTDKNVPVAAGSALQVNWKPMPQSGPTMVRIVLNINLHGTAAGTRISCLVEDNGSFSIPEPLMTSLVNDGLSGFPTLTLTRASSDRARIEPGCVDFKVETRTSIQVSIDGLTSCSNDDDCVAPETCQADLTCG